jgi:hypothetical protein
MLGHGVSAGVAYAQPAAEKPPASDEPRPEKPPAREPLPEPPPIEVGPPPAPPLPPPRPMHRLRNVDLGPDFGVAVRPSGDDSVSYGAATALGAHARIELARWLGFRALFSRSNHPVSIERGALQLPDAQLGQPDLELVLIAGRLEPTWVVMPRLRLWIGVGGGLAYFVAPVARSTGAIQVQSARRTGSAVEIGGALGATFDVIPDWFTVAASGSAAFTTAQSGDAFDPPQAFDAVGHRRYVGALPEFSGSFAAIASLGLVL